MRLVRFAIVATIAAGAMAGCSGSSGHAGDTTSASTPGFGVTGIVDASGSCVHVDRHERLPRSQGGRTICYAARVGLPGACVAVDSIVIPARLNGRAIFPEPDSTPVAHRMCRD